MTSADMAGTDTQHVEPDLDLPAPYRPHPRFAAAFAACPLIAILRGVTPAEAVAHGQALRDAGFRLIEVPLNSPRPFESIGKLRAALPDAIVGAGTVLRPEFVDELARAGGELVVMPHADPAVIRAAKLRGLACAPGVATPTEAFSALVAGADALKMFPAEQLGVPVVKAWRAVIAKRVPLVPVGGVTPDNMAPFLAAGADGFGLGSALYRPGQDAKATGERARAFIEGLRVAREEAWMNDPHAHSRSLPPEGARAFLEAEPAPEGSPLGGREATR
jgi:2-dehydro-3-deoxyphosphogalactonate aldolase